MKRMCLLLLCAVIALGFCGCFSTETPPDRETAEKLYSQYEADIETVVNFMMNTEYHTILIDDYNGTMRANSQSVMIRDEKAQAAIANLLKEEVVDSFYKEMRYIQLMIWEKQDTYCYLVYSIDGKVPSVVDEAEIFPMEEKDWYYIVFDSNAGIKVNRAG